MVLGEGVSGTPPDPKLRALGWRERGVKRACLAGEGAEVRTPDKGHAGLVSSGALRDRFSCPVRRMTSVLSVEEDAIQAFWDRELTKQNLVTALVGPGLGITLRAQSDQDTQKVTERVMLRHSNRVTPNRI